MSHGGARPGSGRKRTPINESRVLSLYEQGVPQHEIARRFGVTLGVIQWFFKKRREQLGKNN